MAGSQRLPARIVPGHMQNFGDIHSLHALPGGRLGRMARESF